METDKVPLEKGSPEEILRKLGDNFSLDDGVIDALLRLGVESLQEFRFLWASEQAIETWVAKLGLGDKALLMTARVRRAWAAVGLYYRQVEQDRSKIALSDLDTMLGETELRDTKQQFWRRYKTRSLLRFTQQTPQFPGWPERCRSACCACTTYGGSKLCNSSSPLLRRSASLVKGCS